MRKTYYQTNCVDLSYEEGHGMAFAVWKGFLSSQEFQEAALKCLDLIEEKGITRWLADNRKMKIIRQADQKWFVETIMPRILQSPLRRMATLVSEDFFNKVAVDQMIKRIGQAGDLALRDFTDEKEAMAWLKAPLSAEAAQPRQAFPS